MTRPLCRTPNRTGALRPLICWAVCATVGFTGCGGNDSTESNAAEKETQTSVNTINESSNRETVADQVSTTTPTASNQNSAAVSADGFRWSPDIVRTPMTFNFPDGWKAEGEIDYPQGGGPFPTIVLFHGSGPNDMDQTLPGEPQESKVLRQLAANLTTRGFAVVRYNKRGVIDIGPKLEPIKKAYTLTTYIDDAKSVLKTVETLERIDPKRIILLGHSEGTLTASVIACAADSQSVAGLVLLGVVGRDIKSTLKYQLIDRTVDQLRPIGKVPGVLTTAELLGLFASMPVAQKQANIDAFSLIPDPSAEGGYRLSKKLDPNGDGALDIDKELKPFWLADFEKSFPNLEKFGMTKDDETWVADTQSYGDVGTILSGYTKPVLMMNGEGDIQTVVAGAREAYAKVQATPKAQAVLKTYPGLGHSFFPANGFEQPLGPMQDGPLTDLGDWLVQEFGTVK
jgi:uncharacterized protein